MIRLIFALLASGFALALLGQPIPAKPKPAGPRRVALVVGVNDYANRNLDALKYAEADAKDLAAELKKAGYEVRLLLGSANGADQATAGNIRAAFAATLKGVTKEDTVLIGLSGHGVQLFVGQGEAQKEIPFFCGRDAVPTEAETMVSLSEMLRALDTKGGGHNLLLVDACRNLVDPNRGGRGIVGSRVQDLGVNTVAFFSCGSRQKARETEKAGGGHGIFFHYVLEGLRGKARDAKGRVTFNRLQTYVIEGVGEGVEEWFAEMPARERQRPVAMGSFEGNMVLADNHAERLARCRRESEELRQNIRLAQAVIDLGKARAKEANSFLEREAFLAEVEKSEEALRGWESRHRKVSAELAELTRSAPR